MNLEQTHLLAQDQAEIDELTHQFFDLFTNTNDRVPPIQHIKQLFLPTGILINNTSGTPAVYNLDQFIAPRVKILTDGTLREFTEKETAHHTEIHNNIAQRSCQYEKSGILNGEPFTGAGRKLMHFIKHDNSWMLTAVVWSDTK